MSDELDSAEQYQRMFVRPVVDALKIELESQLRPLVEASGDHEKRIRGMEAKQHKMLAMYGVFSVLACGTVGSLWNYIRTKLNL